MPSKTRRASKDGAQVLPRDRAVLWAGWILVIVLTLAGIGLVGWQWLQQIEYRAVEVRASTIVSPEEVIHLARIDSGAALYEIDPFLIADRIRRHPWVKRAEIRRVPTGVLTVRLTERQPVVLVLDGKGHPIYYLDRDGYQLGLRDEVAFDLPLIRGLDLEFQPTRPIDHSIVRELLVALADLDERTNALISELEVRPSNRIRLYTAPTPGREAIPVELGRRNFGKNLHRLAAFWRQAVVTQPHKTFTSVDLRFNGQIVVQENVLEEETQ